MVNKGYKHSEETKKKISESMSGDNNPSKRLDVRKKLSLVNKGKITWMKGKQHTDESKTKMSNAKKGISLSEEHKLKISNSHKGNHYPNISKAKIKQYENKENHPNWRGGLSSVNNFLRNKARIKIWREAVFLRDNFICQNKDCKFCNNKSGIYLQAHHIKPLSIYPEVRFDVKNGITYCKDFHIKGGLHVGILRRKK